MEKKCSPAAALLMWAGWALILFIIYRTQGGKVAWFFSIGWAALELLQWLAMRLFPADQKSLPNKEKNDET